MIHGHQYDLRRYNHPGGRFVLDRTRGLDVTNLFESYHLSDTARSVLGRMSCVCCANKAGMPSVPPKKPFTKEVHDYVLRKHPDPSSRKMHPLKMLVGLLLWVSTYMYAMVSTHFVIPCVLFSVGQHVVGNRLLHEGSHMSLPGGEHVNILIGHVCTFPFMPFEGWFFRHVVSHHLHTNDVDRDNDVSVVSYLIPRVREYYMYILLALVGAVWWFPTTIIPGLPLSPGIFVILYLALECAHIMTMNKLYTSKDNEVHGARQLWFFGWAMLHMVCYAVVPQYPMRAAIYGGIVGIAFSFFSALNHLPLLPDGVDPSLDFHEQQVRSSINYGTGSWFWSMVSFGLNQQVEHHVLPGVSHGCFVNIRDICTRHSIPYHEVTFWSSCKMLLGTMFRLGSTQSIATNDD